MADDYLWDPSAPPDPAIRHLEVLLRPLAFHDTALSARVMDSASKRIRMRRWMALAAATVLAVFGLQAVRRASVAPWSVVAERGMPVVRSAVGQITRGALTPGGVVETDARSAAVLVVGRIGRVTLGPGSRLRLLGADAAEHRLALERGTMHASIDAPPRYFLVQTTSALAVDLGCVYTLTADEHGNGLLTVEQGEVELQFGDIRVAVLAGNAAALRSGTAPGLPYSVSASAALRRAIAAYDADPTSAGALDRVLAAADARSTITLWHLLSRADAAGRARAYERLAFLSPPPATVTRDRTLRGESDALQRWRTALQPAWAIEPPFWRRIWLTFDR